MSKKKSSARKPAAQARKAAAKPAARKPGRAGAAATKPGVQGKPGAQGKPRPSTRARARAVANLRFARTILDGLVKDFPAEHLTYQPAMTDNHLIWTLGHLAVTNQWFAGVLDGRPAVLPAEYDALFGYKSKPNPDLAAYPPFEEVKRHHDLQYARLIRAAEALTDDDLTAGCADQTGGFCKDKGEILEKAAWHEGWHSGQVSALRRSLGLPPVMG